MFHLPQDVLTRIYGYDPTYRDLYRDIIQELVVYRVNNLFCTSLREEYRIKSGNIHGWYKILSEYGHPFREFMYRDGMKHGPARFYLWNAYSPPMVECYFEKGLLHGPYRVYDRSGDLVRETWYEHGKKS